MRSWERTSKALIAPVYRDKSLIDGSYSLGLGSAGARSDWGTPLPGIVLRARAIYPYIAPLNYPNDLSFTKGEILDILDIPDSTGKWWQGRKADGNVGMVPSDCLSIISFG
ncbi:Transmembrane osmosensor [Pleurotus ostreatus]|nr:Transmembrane osmosensor [Pleurotus ostreatus]